MDTPFLMDLNAMPWTKGIGPGIEDKKIISPGDSNFMLMSIARMGPGVKSPPHRHKYAQVFYFVQGRGEVEVDGHRSPVGPGSVLRLLKAEEHTVINHGPEELVLLEVRVLPRGSDKWE